MLLEMTSIQEDIMYEIHTKVHSCKKLKEKFYKQLDKIVRTFLLKLICLKEG